MIDKKIFKDVEEFSIASQKCLSATEEEYKIANKYSAILVSVTMNYDKARSIKTLTELVKQGEKALNPRMLKFVNDKLNEIEKE